MKVVFIFLKILHNLCKLMQSSRRNLIQKIVYQIKHQKRRIIWITYINMHNWSLHLVNQDYGIISYATYVVCITFKCEWRDLQFKVHCERQIFETFFRAIIFIFYLLSELLPEIFGEEVIRCLSRSLNRVFISNKTAYYLLDYSLGRQKNI